MQMSPGSGSLGLNCILLIIHPPCKKPIWIILVERHLKVVCACQIFLQLSGKIWCLGLLVEGFLGRSGLGVQLSPSFLLHQKTQVLSQILC